MADTSKKGRGNQKPDAKDKQPQVKQATNVKESKEEEKPAQSASSAPQAESVVINPNTNQPNPQEAAQSKDNRPKKEQRVYQQGKGAVRAVLSGDTLVVTQMEKNGPPQNREIQLTNIEAPKFGRRGRNVKEATPDAAFAFQSREYLRKLLIGVPVSFTVEQRAASEKGNREYGYVYFNKDGKDVDVAKLIVAEGWATVRRRLPMAGAENKQGSQRPEVEELTQLEEAAKKESKGVHSGKDGKTRPTQEVVPSVIYEQHKGAPLQAIVERALTGSTLILTILPSLSEVRLILSGVECPGEKDGEWAPFGREAKFCTEHYLLNREVSVILEGADKNNVYGTLDFRGNNISEELLKRGLAKYVDWSGNRTAFVEKLKTAEKSAREAKLCVWSQYVEPKALSRQEEKKQLRPGKEIIGKVVQVISASTILVLDQMNNEYTVQLSSVILPRGGNMKPKQGKNEKASGDKPAPAPVTQQRNNKPAADTENRADALERTYAWEAKEYLRKRLIGQRVRAVLDYIQPADPTRAQQQQRGPKGQPPREEKDRNCYSVYVDRNNVAVELVAMGFASPRNHKGGEARSKDYEDMLKAENLAKSQHKGRHQNPEKASIIYINDISQDAEQATRFLPSIKRGKQRGVVAHVFHAAKVKIYVPKESCELTVALSALQVPREKEAFSAESIALIRDRIYQREVEFEVSQVDRGGNFVGTVYFNRENLSVLLLQEGYAKLLRGIAQNLENYQELENAEESAKRQHKNIWKDYDEVAEQEARDKRRAERQGQQVGGKAEEYIDVIVTEILDASSFYVQIVGGEDSTKLEELMKNLSLEETDANPDFKPKAGELVKAQYTADDQWYRASITSTEGDNYRVLYIDYGNSETIPSSRVRALGQQFRSLRPQAIESHLAFVKPPTINDDYGQEAAEMLRDLVEEKTLMAQIEYREDNVLFLSLMDSNKLHLNGALVGAGLARVKKPRANFTQKREYIDKLLDELKGEERRAKASHSCVWEYGDPGSDEDEERNNFRGNKKPEKKKPVTSSPATGAKRGGKDEN